MLGFGTLEGHKTHISLLWVIALLALATFVTVAYYVYGGNQENLSERHFDSVKVDKNVDAGGFVETDKTVSLTGGGTSTQVTEQGNVDLNYYTGQITTAFTTFGASASAAARRTFLVNNNKVDANDTVVLSLGTSANSEDIQCHVADVGSEEFKITCLNIGDDSFNFQGPINFAVIKGSTS